MKLLVVSFLILCLNSGNCTELVSPNPDHTAFVVRLESFAANKSEKIWPGYNPLSVPLLLYFEDDGQSFLIGHPNPPQGFSAVNGKLYVSFSSVFPRQINTTFETQRSFAGAATNMFAVPAGYNAQKEVSFISHEVFHNYQNKNFMPRDFKYCEAGPEALALMYIENYIAAKMLLFPGDSALSADFLAVRKRKYEVVPDCSKEDVLETHEGTARYVEMRAMGVPGASAAAKESLDSIRNSGSDPDGARHARDYSTGAALCAALEKVYPGWRAEIEKGRAAWELLSEKLGTVPDLKTVYEKYGYQNFFLRAQANAAVAVREHEELLRSINSYSGFRLRLVPSTGTISMPYTAASTGRAGKYTLLRIENIALNGGCEKMTAHGIQMMTDGGRGLIFMTGNDAPDLRADGKRLSMVKNYSGRAAGLQLTGKNFSLEISCETEINIKNKEIILEVAKNGR